MEYVMNFRFLSCFVCHFGTRCKMQWWRSFQFHLKLAFPCIFICHLSAVLDAWWFIFCQRHWKSVLNIAQTCVEMGGMQKRRGTMKVEQKAKTALGWESCCWCEHLWSAFPQLLLTSCGWSACVSCTPCLSGMRRSLPFALHHPASVAQAAEKPKEISFSLKHFGFG